MSRVASRPPIPGGDVPPRGAQDGDEKGAPRRRRLGTLRRGGGIPSAAGLPGGAPRRGPPCSAGTRGTCGGQRRGGAGARVINSSTLLLHDPDPVAVERLRHVHAVDRLHEGRHLPPRHGGHGGRGGRAARRVDRPAQEGEGVGAPELGDHARPRDPRDAPRGEQAGQRAEGLGTPPPLLSEERGVVAAHGGYEAEAPAELRGGEVGGAEVVDDVRAGPRVHVERRDCAGAEALGGDGEREVAAGVPRDERVIRPVTQDQEAPVEHGQRGLARH